MNHTIQEVLMAHLAANGQHDLAQCALVATERVELTRLAELAIRNTPKYAKTEAMRKINLELDKPENGGRGEATDFVLEVSAHPFQAGEKWYEAYRVEGNVKHYTGQASHDLDRIQAAIVGKYVARSIVIRDKGAK